MALFWHHVFATGVGKNQHILASSMQIDMLRRVGLSNMREILLALSKDPAMIFWLDNNENRKGEPNENYGRELLELFSMGVGNYSEDDIKDCSRAFTGWTFRPTCRPCIHKVTILHTSPSSKRNSDNGEKTFLGHTGNLNGDDNHRHYRETASLREVYIQRHLYNFFVADEPQVPSWERDPRRKTRTRLIRCQTLSWSRMEICATYSERFLTPIFFKEAQFKKVKSPTELVTGILKLVGTYQKPELGMGKYPGATTLMGQELLNPPTVEGWHTGKEWIDGGTLTERINFSVGEVGDSPKTRALSKLSVGSKRMEASYPPDEFVDRCLELV